MPQSLKEFQKDFDAFVKKAQGKDFGKFLSRVGSIAKSSASRAFENETSPFGDKWQTHAPATTKRKLAEKKLGAKILQDSGTLALSIVSHTNEAQKSVSVGSNVRYAAIHQFGGLAGRKHSAKIPSRPFLPINANDELAPDVEKRIKRAVNEYFTL